MLKNVAADIRVTGDLAAGVDTIPNAVGAAQGAQISHRSPAVQESDRRPAAGIRVTGNLAAVVDALTNAASAAQGAQIGNLIRIRSGCRGPNGD